MAELEDLAAFVAVAREGGFRGAARTTGTSASRLSEALRRLETRLDPRGRPEHPRELLDHACLRGRHSGAITAWLSERGGETFKVEPKGPLIVGIGATVCACGPEPSRWRSRKVLAYGTKPSALSVSCTFGRAPTRSA